VTSDNKHRHDEQLHVVAPLGIFGVLASQPEFEQLRGDLLVLQGAIPENERAVIARYLRAGAIVFAIMEYTRDVVGGAFGVSGGSAINTDGVYYWRFDAADYVEHYGVKLPDSFLCHGRALQWVAPAVSPEDVLLIDKYLYEHAPRLHMR
jgi:hypothetical protein